MADYRTAYESSQKKIKKSAKCGLSCSINAQLRLIDHHGRAAEAIVQLVKVMFANFGNTNTIFTTTKVKGIYNGHF